MTLEDCPDCGHDLSTGMVSCPSCGAKLADGAIANFLTWLVLIIGFLMFLGFGGMLLAVWLLDI